jgi:hypothetical protein
MVADGEGDIVVGKRPVGAVEGKERCGTEGVFGEREEEEKGTGSKQEIDYGDCCCCCGSEARRPHKGFHVRVRHIRCMRQCEQ